MSKKVPRYFTVYLENEFLCILHAQPNSVQTNISSAQQPHVVSWPPYWAAEI